MFDLHGGLLLYIHIYYIIAAFIHYIFQSGVYSLFSTCTGVGDVEPF